MSIIRWCLLFGDVYKWKQKWLKSQFDNAYKLVVLHITVTGLPRAYSPQSGHNTSTREGRQWEDLRILTRKSRQWEDLRISTWGDLNPPKTNVVRRSCLSPHFDDKSSYLQEVSSLRVQRVASHDWLWGQVILETKPQAKAPLAVRPTLKVFFSPACFSDLWENTTLKSQHSTDTGFKTVAEKNELTSSKYSWVKQFSF